ncbi:MAG: type IV secretory system conjugative DNA transfer family protein [Clostridium tyrobutyricum]|uniref:VirD4-like conjugal transfer protein, CD1115 family n=2 Tax=Clostridium tyrobutyricum TaxID=1519 RepID=UPI002430C430|nr:type IV secretory system conjugative DNA transfer family protein [Clostridium tyrobutyricum]MCH4259723.1 type IV secretory system conjugative DNA transfer family protein [Clostridium tyrobutyricum]
MNTFMKKGMFIINKTIIIISAVASLFIDILILPPIVKIPLMLKKYGLDNFSSIWINDIKHNPLQLFNVLKDKDLRILLLVLSVIVFIFLIITLKGEKVATNIVGGPIAKGNGQYGTSRFQYESETDNTSTVWRIEEKDKLDKGGIVLGMKPPKHNKDFYKNRAIRKLKLKKESKTKAWLETKDVNTLILGSSRSGKSRKVILETIWNLGKAGESMLLTDPKMELYRKSKKYLERNGYKVIIIDLRKPSQSNKYNPNYLVNEAVKEDNIARASEGAWDIANMIVNQKPRTGDPVWVNGEEATIASLILLNSIEADEDLQKHMGSVYRDLFVLGCANEQTGSYPIVKYMNSLDVNHPARAAFATATLAPPRQRGSFFADVSASLRLWSDPAIIDMTSRQDHDLDILGREKTAVFINIEDEKETKNIIASMYINQTYEHLVDLANKQEDNRLPIRVNFLLDEIGNLPAIPNLDKKMAVCLGRGMRFNLVLQDLGQLDKNYGKDASRIIKANCHDWIYLLTMDMDTARQISERTDKYTIEIGSKSKQTGKNSTSEGSSESHTGRVLLLPSEILRFPENMSLVFRARQFPAVLPLPDLSVWEKADRELEETSLKELDRDINVKYINTPIWIPDISSNTIDSNKKERMMEQTQENQDEIDRI